MSGIPVLAAPAIDPGAARIELTFPDGLTLAEIVAAALPGAGSADAAMLRVTLVGSRGASLILPEHWRSVRPRPGVRVVIRVVPGKNALRAILSIVVSIAAVALGAYFGPMLAGTFGMGATTWGAIISAGANLIGNMLINALIPPVKPDDERRNSYSVTGWRNRFDPDGAVPVLLGQIRYAPPFAARTYTEIAGDWQYVRAVFNFGEGPLELTDFRIGDTSIAEYDELELEVRQGLSGDQPLSLFPLQIVEEAIGVELTRPLPRDDLGEVIEDAPTEEEPVVRTTGADARSASVILAFPGGLIRFNDKGNKRTHEVRVRIEQRLVQAEAWTTVTTLIISAKKIEAFYRQHTWTLPSRGRWQVRLTMLTDETEDSKVQARTVWAALQTLRPEYPIAYKRPLALVSVRVKATHQLSGALDNFSAMGKRICPDWDHVSQTWITRATSNPASLYRFVLQCPASPKPVPDAEIDLVQLADWHDFCRVKGLHYNRVQDQSGSTLRDVLTEVAAAGRATPRHDGVTWGVVIDRPAALIVDHINPRNSWSFSASRTYAEKPHAWICKFQDQGNDFKEAERTIRRPGYTGDITLTETLSLPGITDPAIIYREGLRRFYEAEHRPDVFVATQEGSVRVATRGDAVMMSHDILSNLQWAGRVTAVVGSMVQLDAPIEMIDGHSYALRFRTFAGPEDTIGTSIVRPVRFDAGEADAVVLDGSGAMPLVGEIVHFGMAGQDSQAVMVTRIEMTEDQCQIIRAVAAAPIIDELTDAAVIPAWSSRVGAEVAASALPPAVPRITSVRSGMAWTDTAGMVDYLVEPGPGAVQVSVIQIEHRLSGAATWTAVSIPVANGGGRIATYTTGQSIELRARSVSISGVAGPYTAILPMTVGADDAPIPAALDADAITVTPLLGGVLVQAAIGSDPNISAVQVFRSMTASLNRATDAVGLPLDVVAQQSFSVALGDTTRQNLIAGGTMDTPASWTLGGAGWTITASKATHASGAVGTVTQAVSLAAGKYYRLAITVSGRTAGQIQPRLIGGTTRSGVAVLANGTALDRIQAVTGNTSFQLYADAAFAGSADNVVVYQETSACLAQGTHYIWLEPRNADDLPGPLTGPITVTIT